MITPVVFGNVLVVYPLIQTKNIFPLHCLISIVYNVIEVLVQNFKFSLNSILKILTEKAQFILYFGLINYRSLIMY